MFKSVFSKYLATFILIILCIFIILFFVISSMISNYENDIRNSIMDVSSELTLLSLHFQLDESEVDIDALVTGKRDILINILNSAGKLSESDVFLINGEGRVLLSSDIDYEASFPSETLRGMIENPGRSVSSIGDTFSELHINYIHPLRDSDTGDTMLAVLVSAELGKPQFTNSVLKMILAVSLWIALAAIIAAYFMSEGIVAPIKEIGAVSKKFSRGDFSERVKVSGHDEIAELAEIFNKMADSLSRLEDMRSGFLANVSHDLRTPMTTISGFVDGILDGTIPPERHEHYLEIISTETRRLSRLVNTLLDISKLEAGDITLNRMNFNLSEKVRQVLISFEAKISEKNIDIIFDSEEDIYTNADPDRLHQVVYNLLDNAVKFTPEHGLITISIKPDGEPKKAKNALIFIENSGQGIPPEEIPYLFERFYKSDRSRGLDKTGTGLGLYIAKTTLLNHGHDISVESEYGSFTRFSFTLDYIVN